MTTRSFGMFIGGEAVAGGRSLEVLDKWTGAVVGHAALGSAEELEQAIAAAVGAEPEMAGLAIHRRRDALLGLADGIGSRRDEFAEMLRAEAGKPITAARGEVERTIVTIRSAAGEAERLGGEVLALDTEARSEGYVGMVKRVPVGACSFITPFNFPLNLVAHKIAPAIACGCPFVLKPAERTPLTALMIGEELAKLGLPAGSWSILALDVGDAGPLVGDDRFKLLSFTGSQTVGWALKAKAGKKKVALELGGNAACVVDESADVDDAAERIVVGGYGYSGQSCISVQRVLVHESRYDELREAMVGRVSELAHGDTRDAETVVGPLIDEAAAARVEAWIEEARAGGASVLCGGTREATAGGARSLVRGAVLAGVAPDARLACDEVFGPVTVLERFGSFDEALERVNDSDFGLQAGVFTRDIGRSHAAWDRLRVGAVLINEIPSWRVDPMPYGGVKDSGLGREGPRYAIEEMTERRMMVVRG